MAKEYSTELGGKKRVLRYTRAERIDIENRFECDIRDFVYERAFPMRDGKPTGGGRLECQEALIWYGLRHNGPKVTEEWVSQQLTDEVAKGGSIYAPLSQSIVALLASGVMGWNPKMADEEEAAEEGKEDAAPAGPVAAPALTIAPIKKTG
ncbi:MAG: hypothetical protein RL409_213 [Gemmatimonadota bacterium]